MTRNQIKTIKIDKIEKKCKNVKTFTFNISNIMKTSIKPSPGQFIMVWVPGIDEVPMSISHADSMGNWSITVKKVGECTEAMHNLKKGDFIGVRGPLGNSFSFPKNHRQLIFLVGGGIGMAPLKFLAEELYENNFKFILIEGAQQKSEIIYREEFHVMTDKPLEIIFCTDDGSKGYKGFAPTIFEEELNKYSKKKLLNAITYTCGPEKMMYEVFKICEQYSITLEASLERMMRCGCGLCGLCTIDPLGLLVCKDGPVFNSELLRKTKDFGSYKRDAAGVKHPIQ